VEKKGTLHVRCLNEELVVFRGEDGKAHILDAFCPHMGANLGVGGKVRGNCLECPFHKWQFKGDGQCNSIPYCDSVPSVTKTKSWPMREYNGLICIYYHSEGKPPTHEPLEITEITNGQLTYRGSWERDVYMHLQEFAENSADFQHFAPLHGQLTIPWTLIPIPFMSIQHEAGWKIDQIDNQSHIAYFSDEAKLKIFNYFCFPKVVTAVITFVGCAGIVYFTFTTPIGNIMIIQSHTPYSLACQRTRFAWYADWKIPRILVWFVVGNWVSQWMNDISIWENKTFSQKPKLVRGDGPIMQLRRWYSQFYSKPKTEIQMEF